MRFILLSIIILICYSYMFGCQANNQQQTVTSPTQTNTQQQNMSGPAIIGELNTGFQKTTISEIEQIIGIHLPVPSYLPAGLKIEEVYTYQEPDTSPTITDILILISDAPVIWHDSQYTCRLLLEIGWNEAGLGLKNVDAQFIPEIKGRLQKIENQQILWWESYGGPGSLGSTLRLYADIDFSFDDMLKIALSTPELNE